MNLQDATGTALLFMAVCIPMWPQSNYFSLHLCTPAAAREKSMFSLQKKSLENKKNLLQKMSLVWRHICAKFSLRPYFTRFTQETIKTCAEASNNIRRLQSTPGVLCCRWATAWHPVARTKEESEELNGRQTDARTSSPTAGCSRTPTPEGHRVVFPSRDPCLCVSVVFTALHGALSELPSRWQRLHMLIHKHKRQSA